MTENWYKAYFAAITGVCADSGVEDAKSAVKFAGWVADASEEELATREKKERIEASDAQQKRIADATTKVLTTKVYKVTAEHGGVEMIVDLVVEKIVGTTVCFLPNDANVATADLFDVEGEEGFTASAPTINA